jgi:REP element-mobilizing transposase RayT
MLHENLSQLIRWYKGHITFKSRKINPDFAWQRNFYDHIVRDEFELDRIRLYIRQNPTEWEFDCRNQKINKRVEESNTKYGYEVWMI